MINVTNATQRAQKTEKLVVKKSCETLIYGFKQENKKTLVINWKLFWSP